MLKKILLIPLALLVAALFCWALSLVAPTEITVPFLICLTAILLFPLPLLPIATTMPHGKVRNHIHRLGEAVIGPYLYFLIFVVLDAALLLFSHFSGLFEINLPVLFASSLGYWGVVLLIGAKNARRIKTVRHEIRFGKNPEKKVRAVLISDLHLGYFSSLSFIGRMVKAINDAAPSYLFIAGDLFDSDYVEVKKKEETLALLKQIKAPEGKFMCMGNHDLYAKGHPDFRKFLDEAEFTLLHDSSLSLEHFELVGRSDVKEKKRADLSALMPQSPRPKIVLCHNPKDAKRIVNAGGDLVLCGHTHNGQTFPGNLASKIKSKYSYGLNRCKDAFVLTTAGVGYWGPPLRVFTNNEIVILDLYF